MLVLTRRIGEEIIIGDATVSVISVKGYQVRLRVTAPPQVSVHREEVYLRLQQDKQHAPTQSETVSTVSPHSD